MKVLFFSHEKSFGGASRSLITLIENIKMEHENIYVVVPFKNSKIVNELKKLNVNLIYCFYSWWQIPTNVSKTKKVFYRLAYLLNNISKIYLTNKIKKLDIDIIHSNTSVIDIGAKVAKKLKIPHVWHFREFTGKHLNFIKGEKKSYKFINKYGGNIIYISKSVKAFYEMNINKNIGNLIYNGISEKYYCEKKYKIGKQINFLLVGTLEKNKGQEFAIKAINILKNENINNIKLILAGGDSSGYKKKLIQLVNEYNIGDYVEFVGFVNDVKKLRQNVDVELMCSPNEAFGLVTVEGMMAGNPIIGSNSSGTAELIIDGKTGYLFEANNEVDLANKMKLFINDPKLIKVMGKQAAKNAKDKFSAKITCEKIINLYNKIV